MPEITITVGDEVFRFSNFEDWCDTARYKFESSGLSSHDAICVDARGRLCFKGKDFMQARDDRSFPIRVFAATPPLF
jgi:hypothetical protein